MTDAVEIDPRAATAAAAAAPPTMSRRDPPPARPLEEAAAGPRGHRGPSESSPQVERLMSFVGSPRYVLFSIAATAIAVASTAHHVIGGRAEGEDGNSWEAMTTGSFVRELSRSRLNGTIVLHFYFVVLYHIFLAVTRACFGVIRRPEIQQTKETILHFLLMRTLLLTSTLGGAGVKPPIETLLVWLSIVAFLRGILSICNARFEHLLTRPMTRAQEFHRLAFTLLAMMATNIFVAVGVAYAGVFSVTVIHLTWFEASLYFIKGSQLATKVVFHVFDIGNVAENGLEKGEYYLLVLQTWLTGAYLIQLVIYYLYIISIDHFRVSFLDFILILNVKNATVQLLEKIKQVQMYQQVVVELDLLFPDATRSELEAVQDDVCVICLKKMDVHAKKLDCGHLFHRACIRQCLQKASVGDSFAGIDPLHRPVRRDDPVLQNARQSSILAAKLRCPICRKPVDTSRSKNDSISGSHSEPRSPLNEDEDPDRAQPRGATPTPIAEGPATNPPPAAVPENVLRISTEFLSRYIPIPNVAFEIVRPAPPAPFTVTDEMVHRIWEMFPQYSVETIRRDLLRTRSPERTIERILSGRLQEHPEARGMGDAAAVGTDGDHWNLTNLWNARFQ